MKEDREKMNLVEKGTSRRNFIKHAAAGALGVASLGVLTACNSKTATPPAPPPAPPKDEMEWKKESDVVIVGAGGSGLVAAIEAITAGAKVLILEKAEKSGGTTAVCGGVIQASSTDYQKANTPFKDDTPEKHFKLWLKAGEGTTDESLVKDLAYGAPDDIKWLTNLGVKFKSIVGHSHIPYIDESLYADRLHNVEGGGKALAEILLNAAVAKGAVIEYQTEVTKLLTNESGEVIGVLAKQGGSEINVKAKKGVILASGGIDQNVELAKQLNPQQYWALTTQQTLVAKTNTGDGIRMGMEVGAAVFTGGTIDISLRTRAGLSNIAPMLPAFYVNKKGRRFVCEDTTYAFNFRAIFQQEKMFDSPTYTIFGKSSLAAPGAPWNDESVKKEIEGGLLITADTIEELAKKIEVDPPNLAATLATWNADMKNKKDNQFDRKTGLEPIQGPFYAYKNTTNNLGSIGGLKINAQTEVIHVNGKTIPRLFAVGMNSAGWIGPFYPGSGTAIMGCIHWGRKAGTNAAKLS
ncbi:MAG: FAD-dependent oxidoreductase [Desulfitobacterium sp.]